jgi:hypothetical protein
LIVYGDSSGSVLPTGADLGWVAGEVLVDDIQAELAQDRGGRFAFEKELGRRPNKFLGGDVTASEAGRNPAGTPTSWLVPAGVWTWKVPSA